MTHILYGIDVHASSTFTEPEYLIAYWFIVGLASIFLIGVGAHWFSKIRDKGLLKYESMQKKIPEVKHFSEKDDMNRMFNKMFKSRVYWKWMSVVIGIFVFIGLGLPYVMQWTWCMSNGLQGSGLGC